MMVAIPPGGALDSPPAATQTPVSGWQARLALEFAPRGERTQLVGRSQLGPLTVQRPFHPEGAPCHLYLLHPPGGVVGGDELALHIDVAAGGHALLTTPGATKFYRSLGPQARVRQHFSLASGATLEWLPQDNILFPGARLDLASHFHLQPGARLLAWETLALGRPVIGERFTQGALHSRLQLYQAGRLQLNECLRVQQPRDLTRPAGLAGHPLLATLLATPCGETEREAVREILGTYAGPAGVTRLGDLLVVRLLGEHNEPLQQCMQAIWRALRPAVLGRPPCAPRIWAT